MLDRVLLSIDWETHFPHVTLLAKPCLRSDHSALLVSCGVLAVGPPSRFRFESSWFLRDDFLPLVISKWTLLCFDSHRSFGSTDDWRHCSQQLRRFLRGLGANVQAEALKSNVDLGAKIKTLDLCSDSNGHDADGWKILYDLEVELVSIHHKDELYWKLRSNLNWILKGDANTTYFQAIANGRRRRCLIASLVIDGTPCSDQAILSAHIYEFYSSLLSERPPSGISFDPGAWVGNQSVSLPDMETLSSPISCEEIDVAISSSKSNSAPDPDGFTIPFFKKFWPALKLLIYAICIGFCLGTVDISRLNYACLSLIPKVKGADHIRLFRPIAMITNIVKFPSKAFATKLSPVAHKLISPTQSTFIKGRYILDGILVLDHTYVSRLMQLVTGGHTSITINGVVAHTLKMVMP